VAITVESALEIRIAIISLAMSVVPDIPKVSSLAIFSLPFFQLDTVFF
jgi:hypothetical protein